MLIDQKFQHLSQAFNSYSTLYQRNKLKSKYNFLLGSSIYLTALVSVFSIVALYHHSGCFNSIFSGKDKLFGRTIPVVFSIALIVAIPSFILLFFLIYKICATQDITDHVVERTNDLIKSAREVCEFLKEKLHENTCQVEALVGHYGSLAAKHDDFVKKCSRCLQSLEEQQVALGALVRRSTSVVDNNISEVQALVVDLKAKIAEMSVAHVKLMDASEDVREFIVKQLRLEGLGLQHRMRFLDGLQGTLSQNIDVSDAKSAMKIIIERIENEIPKVRFAFNSLNSMLWSLHSHLLKALLGLDKDSSTDGCITVCQELVNALHKFLGDMRAKIDNYNGSDKRQFVNIGLVEVPLLQIMILRLMATKRACMFEDVCASVKDFIESGTADRSSSTGTKVIPDSAASAAAPVTPTTPAASVTPTASATPATPAAGTNDGAEFATPAASVTPTASVTPATPAAGTNDGAEFATPPMGTTDAPSVEDLSALGAVGGVDPNAHTHTP
ncbi:hypothetical protein [Ehrlichia chaffeensis]|uniref:hypothetical protein n=1 Tax=Ehrlichia chaffeensis TaxID=945 RepID=UPI0005C468B3|nr:hypothetical protein [Ehrlichia chaffeensis]